MMTELFLTGATGFIGSSILQKWLDDSDARVTLLARAKRGVEPRERLRALLGELYPGAAHAGHAERVSLVVGDLAEPRCGLAQAEYEQLAERITHILHCGGAVRFDLTLDEARRVNCNGARNAVDLAAACKELHRLDYVGTAYVAGKRSGVIAEDELDEGQAHNNTYERSKFEAELQVREAMRKLPIAIHRPTIVIGDARTGRISPVGAFFRVLKMYALGLLPALPGDPSAPMDLVSLDYTTAAMFEIASDAGSIGKCFHLSAGTDNLTTLAEVSELAAHHFGREPFRVIPPEEFERGVLRAQGGMSEEERKMVEEIRLYLPYLTGNWHFDDSNTRQILQSAGLRAPRVRDYFAKMAAHISDRG